MLSAISLDNQAVLRAGEIDDETADRMLPAKSVTGETAIPQNSPEPVFGVS